MRTSMFAVPIALVAILSPAVVRAADITYTVNQSVGTSGSMTGYITTDGNSGLLATSDILDWNLVVNDGTNPSFDLNGLANSQAQVLGSDLTATATQLLFDFSGGDSGYLLFENLTIGDGGPFACFEADSYCSGAPAGVSLAANDGEGDIIYTSMDGTGVIGTAGAAPTPEPESLFLLGSGLLGVVGMARRKFAV
jgi:PEP-CTERM motif